MYKRPSQGGADRPRGPEMFPHRALYNHQPWGVLVEPADQIKERERRGVPEDGMRLFLRALRWEHEDFRSPRDRMERKLLQGGVPAAGAAAAGAVPCGQLAGECKLWRSLQSPHDPDVTKRSHKGKGYEVGWRLPLGEPSSPTGTRTDQGRTGADGL